MLEHKLSREKAGEIMGVSKHSIDGYLSDKNTARYTPVPVWRLEYLEERVKNI